MKEDIGLVMNKQERLKKLYEEYREAFKGKEIVMGEGNPDAQILLIGEAPGKEEVRLSRPFVGMAGKNLDTFLDILGLQRDALYITNTVKYRLSAINPKTGREINRPATSEDIRSSRKYLLEEIHIIQPRYIVTLGNVPLKALMEKKDIKIGDVHGEFIKVEVLGRQYDLFPLYHPASILYNQSLKDVYLKDVKKLGKALINGKDRAGQLKR